MNRTSVVASSSSSSERILAAWAEHDAARALHAVDRDVIRAAEPLRSLILDLFDHRAPARDLFNASARLGALLAAAGASPSLAAGTIDGAIAALTNAKASFDLARAPAARASLIEGFALTLRDLERENNNLAWEYPGCAVPLEAGVVAIACGFPTDDAEALSLWSARLAGRLSKEKIRRVLLAGSDAATAEVASAASLVGIEVLSRMPQKMAQTTAADEEAPKAEGNEAPTSPKEKKSWLRLPWRK